MSKEVVYVCHQCKNPRRAVQYPAYCDCCFNKEVMEGRVRRKKTSGK